jgi:hypothetical protein
VDPNSLRKTKRHAALLRSVPKSHHRKQEKD